MLDQNKSKQQLLEELAEMRRREAKWRLLVANMPAFVCLVDRAGTIRFLNHTAPGHTLEDTIGKDVCDFIEPTYREIARECIERAFATGQAGSYEPVAAGPNGSLSWYETHVSPVKVDDQVVAVMLVSNDVTQRRQAQAALRESEERFKLFMNNSPAIAWMKDEQGRYVYVNESGARRVGMRPEERIGKTDFELWPKATAELFWKNDQKVLSEGQVVEVVEESTKPDGTRSYCRNFKFPFHDSIGRRFVGGVGIEITAQKQAEEALQKAHDVLEQRVKERTAELAKANENLKHLLHASDHERRLIAYEIHDGLAQQLAGALMQLQACDYLKDKNPQQAEKAYRTGLTMLQQSHYETRRLIAGVRPPILDEEGIAAAVGHLVHEQIRLDGPKIDFRSRLDSERLDRTLENAVYRIAQEALTNACKHSKSARISIQLLRRGDRLRVEIRDWGAGFDPKTVFKNHFGLEGIRQRARLLGGKCSIRSKAGKGTSISVELPVVFRDSDG